MSRLIAQEAQHIAKVTGKQIVRRRGRESKHKHDVHSGTTRVVYFGSQNANIYINLTPGRAQAAVQRGKLPAFLGIALQRVFTASIHKLFTSICICAISQGEEQERIDLKRNVPFQ